MAKSRQSRKRTSTSTLVLSLLLMLSVVLLLLLALGILSLPVSSNDPRPAHDLRNFGRKVLERGLESEMNNGLRFSLGSLVLFFTIISWIVILSEIWMEPLLTSGEGAESKEECEYLIDLAKPHMAKSTVVDSKTGRSKDSRVRTSSGMFLRRGQDKIIRDIEKRIADFTFIPVEHGEGLQILHYEEGQKYEPHYDYFLDEFNKKNGGQRIATVLMYLSDVEEGGETVFPASRGNFSSLTGWNERSECAKRGLSVRPKMGDALLFWSMRPDATLDSSSLHGGCPVIKGNKWSSTKWMHVEEYKI
uniref:procollagen-proline 4-dioxygenase n=1 Tax=Chenopodium quinoa TaxID=63459 RepID=A0A803MWX9_CHEQI